MRKFAVHFFSLLFTGTFSLFVLAFILNSTILSGERVTSWLEKASTVNLAVENAPYLLDDLTENSKKNAEEIEIQLSDEAKLATGEALSEPLGENLLKPASEKVISDFYAWLKAPEYEPFQSEIDLSTNNKELKSALTKLLNENKDIIPRCKSGQEGMCLESGVSTSEFVNKLFKEISGKDGFLKVVDINTSGDSEETFQTIHDSYGIFKTVFLWLGVATLLFAAIAIFAGRDKLHDVKVVAKYFVGAFTLPIILTIAALFLVPDEIKINIKDFSATGIEVVSRIISPLVATIVGDFVRIYLSLTLPLLLASIAALIFIHDKTKNLPEPNSIKTKAPAKRK